MGVRTTSHEGKVALYDSVTDQAFGPVFDSDMEADTFMMWYNGLASKDPTVPPLSYWTEPRFQRAFNVKHGEWHRATHDVNTGEFRTDIAIQMAREAS